MSSSTPQALSAVTFAADSRYPHPGSLPPVPTKSDEINGLELAGCGVTTAAAGSELSATSSGPAAIQLVPVCALQGVWGEGSRTVHLISTLRSATRVLGG